MSAKLRKLATYKDRSVDKTNTWLLFLFLGWSYGSMEQGWKQLFYYCTGGGLGVWTIYRLFTLNKAIRQYNLKIANEVGISNKDKLLMGLINSYEI
jgi:hypothetical protein